MDPLTFEVSEVDPGASAVRALIETHLDLMRASSPACSRHAMDAESLRAAGARFFAIFDGETAVAIGAIKRIAPGHGELKSMHVRQSMRGRGLARAMLAHLLAVARESGLVRVSLETGSQEPFAAARAFYGRSGFDTCPPFGAYRPDPNSVFMTRAI